MEALDGGLAPAMRRCGLRLVECGDWHLEDLQSPSALGSKPCGEAGVCLRQMADGCSHRASWRAWVQRRPVPPTVLSEASDVDGQRSFWSSGPRAQATTPCARGLLAVGDGLSLSLSLLTPRLPVRRERPHSSFRTPLTQPVTL